MSDTVNGIQIPSQSPQFTSQFNANQRQWKSTSNIGFYNCLPPNWYSFYTRWVKRWLEWYDGFVPSIHGSQYGLYSTNIATAIVNRCNDQVFGGNLKFANARKPTQIKKTPDGKIKGSALDFVANKFMLDTNGKEIIKKAGRFALAGGFSLLKLNKAGGELWLDTLRADRFYIDLVGRNIRKVVCVLEDYMDTSKQESERYTLLEERRYETIGLIDEIPVVEYKIMRSDEQIQYLTDIDKVTVKWEELPKTVRKAFKASYGTMLLNKPQAMNGFSNLGVYLLKASDGISDIPQIPLGESILNSVETYLFGYDFWYTCLMTDVYLGRGKVLVPKYMQRGTNAGSNPNGLDEFIYTKYEQLNINGGDTKPEAIQFDLRSQDWHTIRNTLLENMSTHLGISVSTLGGYLQDGSNRTAREVSAEESATTLFVESMRRRFEQPINAMIADVLRFYGFVDDVEVRWSRSGFTNPLVLVETLTGAINAGIISREKAHSIFNDEDDEEQNEEDYKKVKDEQAEQRQYASNDIWGDVGNGTEVSEIGS